MRYSIVATIIFALAFTFALLGCENAGETDEVELEKIANNPPPSPPEEMKEAETAYQFLIENWIEGNFENVYLALDGESLDYLGMAWDTYINAREFAYEEMGAEAEAYFNDESIHGDILKLEGIQQFFAYTINESGSSNINIEDDVKAAGFKITKQEETEIESRPGVEAVTFESNYLGTPITMFKEGEFWVTDYWVGDCQDSIGQADICLDDVGNDAGGF